MARKPKVTKDDVEIESPASLRWALHWVLSIVGEPEDWRKFHKIDNRWLVASASCITVGHPIDVDISDSPVGAQLYKALERCKASYSLTQVQGGMSLRSGAFRAVVPCQPIENCQIIEPNPPLAPFSAAILDAINKCAVLIKNQGERFFETSLLIKANSCVATDSRALIEAWHGINMPEVIIPYDFVVALRKAKAIPTQFGFDDKTFTVYYENGAWITTNIYNERFPQTDRLFTDSQVPKLIPEKFFEAIKAVEPFATENRVYFEDGKVKNIPIEDCTFFEIPELTATLTINPKYLLLMPEGMKRYSIEDNSKIYLYGDDLRAVVMGIIK
jgi:hypothetical protein